MIRELFQPEVYKMHIIFCYLQVAAAVRFGVYCWVRFQSVEAFTSWIAIADVYFYITYFTELWICFGLFAFLFHQINTERTKPEVIKEDSSVAEEPMHEDGSVVQVQNRKAAVILSNSSGTASFKSHDSMDLEMLDRK